MTAFSVECSSSSTHTHPYDLLSIDDHLHLLRTHQQHLLPDKETLFSFVHPISRILIPEAQSQLSTSSSPRTESIVTNQLPKFLPTLACSGCKPPQSRSFFFEGSPRDLPHRSQHRPMEDPRKTNPQRRAREDV